MSINSIKEDYVHVPPAAEERFGVEQKKYEKFLRIALGALAASVIVAAVGIGLAAVANTNFNTAMMSGGITAVIGSGIGILVVVSDKPKRERLAGLRQFEINKEYNTNRFKLEKTYLKKRYPELKGVMDFILKEINHSILGRDVDPKAAAQLGWGAVDSSKVPHDKIFKVAMEQFTTELANSKRQYEPFAKGLNYAIEHPGTLYPQEWDIKEEETVLK